MVTAEIQYYFEQEIGWIAVNLANGSNEVVHSLLFDASEDGTVIPSPVMIEFLRRSLISSEPAKKHMALWLTANATGESP